MRRVLALLLACALLFQFNWAVAATYCEHETSTATTPHFGHHVHVHHSADGKPLDGGALAADDDCAFHHAGHPALVPRVSSVVVIALPSRTAFPEPAFSASAPRRTPDRPQWPRLA